MRYRKSVGKHASASKFRQDVRHTKAANMRQIMRGGWRL